MGVVPETLLLVQQTQGTIWQQTFLEEEEEAINKARLATIRRRRSNSLMKKMRRRRRRRSNGIEKRVSTLRSLVPNMNKDDNVDGINYDHESATVGLEHLFTRTADYILSLQTRIRLMQTLVDVLSGSSSSSSE